LVSEARFQVLVGHKPVLTYVRAIVTMFNVEGAERVTVKARGKVISRAVDVAEMIRRSFLRGLVDVEEITTGTEFVEVEGGRERAVSTITIVLARVAE